MRTTERRLSALAALTRAGSGGDQRGRNRSARVTESATLTAGPGALFWRDGVQGTGTQLLGTIRNPCPWENWGGAGRHPQRVGSPGDPGLPSWGRGDGCVASLGFLPPEGKGIPQSRAGLNSELEEAQPPVKDRPGKISSRQDARKEFHTCLTSLKKH